MADHIAVSTATIRAGDVIAEQTAIPERRWTRTPAELCSARQALSDAEALIKSERCKDFTGVLPKSLRMRPDTGGIYAEREIATGKNRGDNAIGYTYDGLQHLCALLGAPRGSASVMTDPAIKLATRASIFRDIVESTDRAHTDPLVMRTVVHQGQRVLRAAVSERHSGETGDDLVMINALRAVIPDGAKVRYVRTWDSSSLEVILANPIEVKRGDVVHAKVSIANSETKARRWDVNGGLHRLVCLNGLTRVEENAATSGKHIGDISRKVARAIQEASKGIEAFARQFVAAQTIEFPAALQTEADVLKRVGKVYALPESTLTLAQQMWGADGAMGAGRTLAGVANALTRASQSLNIEDAEIVESAAGDLVARGWGALG